MFTASNHSSADEKPAPGWACIAIGVGFIAGLGLCLFTVLKLAGY